MSSFNSSKSATSIYLLSSLTALLPLANALTTLAARYNLTMSCLWSQKQLVVAKDQFMMSVGRVKMA